MPITIRHGTGAYVAGAALVAESALATREYEEYLRKKAEKHAKTKKREGLAIAAGTLAVGLVAAPLIAGAVFAPAAAAAETVAIEATLAAGGATVGSATAAAAAASASVMATGTALTSATILGLGGMAAAYSADGDVAGAGLQAAGNIANTYQQGKLNEQRRLQNKADFMWKANAQKQIRTQAQLENIDSLTRFYADERRAEDYRYGQDIDTANKIFTGPPAPGFKGQEWVEQGRMRIASADELHDKNDASINYREEAALYRARFGQNIPQERQPSVSQQRFDMVPENIAREGAIEDFGPSVKKQPSISSLNTEVRALEKDIKGRKNNPAQRENVRVSTARLRALNREIATIAEGGAVYVPRTYDEEGRVEGFWSNGSARYSDDKGVMRKVLPWLKKELPKDTYEAVRALPPAGHIEAMKLLDLGLTVAEYKVVKSMTTEEQEEVMDIMESGNWDVIAKLKQDLESE